MSATIFACLLHSNRVITNEQLFNWHRANGYGFNYSHSTWNNICDRLKLHRALEPDWRNGDTSSDDIVCHHLIFPANYYRRLNRLYPLQKVREAIRGYLIVTQEPPNPLTHQEQTEQSWPTGDPRTRDWHVHQCILTMDEVLTQLKPSKSLTHLCVML